MTEPQPFGVQGTPLSAWQNSVALGGVQPITLGALVPPGSRLVILAPHPDDEVLACGGLLAGMVERQHDLQLISVTDGEGSHPGSTDWPQLRLRAQRVKESECAITSLGLDLSRISWQRLGMADGDIAAGSESLIALLSEDLRATDILLSTWRHDGHCDHEAVGHCAAQAAANTGATLVEMPVWAWHWAEPNDPRIPWDRARKLWLSDEQQMRKRRAITAHISQLHPDHSTGAAPVLDATTLQRLLQPFELVFI